MKNQSLHSIILIFTLLLCTSVLAQRVCKESKMRVTLSNDFTVDVYKEKGSDSFYYVPVSLQLSMRNKTPEYSFQEFKKNNVTEGAIFHCLVTWGITKRQKTELQQCITTRYGAKAILAGAIQLDATSQSIIFSNTPIGKILKESLSSKGSIPTLSNSKMAMSFKIKKEHVATLKNALKTPYKLKNTTITLSYQFNIYNCKSAISTAAKNKIKVTGKLQNWF